MREETDHPGSKKRLRAIQMLARGAELARVAGYVGYPVDELRALVAECADFGEVLAAEHRYMAKSDDERSAESELMTLAAVERGVVADRVALVVLSARLSGALSRAAGKAPRTREDALKRTMQVVAEAPPEAQREFYTMPDAASDDPPAADDVPLYRPFVSETGDEEYYDIDEDPDTAGAVTVEAPSSDAPVSGSPSTSAAEHRPMPSGCRPSEPAPDTPNAEIWLRYPKEPLPYHLRGSATAGRRGRG